METKTIYNVEKDLYDYDLKSPQGVASVAMLGMRRRRDSHWTSIWLGILLFAFFAGMGGLLFGVFMGATGNPNAQINAGVGATLLMFGAGIAVMAILGLIATYHAMNKWRYMIELQQKLEHEMESSKASK